MFDVALSSDFLMKKKKKEEQKRVEESGFYSRDAQCQALGHQLAEILADWA